MEKIITYNFSNKNCFDNLKDIFVIKVPIKKISKKEAKERIKELLTLYKTEISFDDNKFINI